MNSTAEKLLSHLGITLCILAAIMATLISQLVYSEYMIAIASVTFLIGSTCILIGKRLKIQLASTQNPPSIENAVLYLRAFSNDFSIFKFIKSGGTGGSFLNPCSEEEQLMQVLASVGPPVAVGRPSEWLPPTGAQRIYLDDTVWKENVSTMIDSAALIILQMGEGEGLQWELKKVLSSSNRYKLLIYCNKLTKNNYSKLISTIEELLKVRAPEFKEIKKGGYVNGFLVFQQDNNVIFLPRQAPFLRKGASMIPKVEFHYTLKPVLLSFGSNWKPYPISLYAISITSVPIFIILIVASLLIIPPL